MAKFYEFFEDTNHLFGQSISEIELYEGYFAKAYSMLFRAYEEELALYLQQAYCCGKNVLELACGDGRIMRYLAENGFHVDGVELSEHMLGQLEEKMKGLKNSVRKRIHYFHQNVFDFESSKKYDLVIIPATTICLLLDDEEKTIELFHRIYDMLAPEGRFIFDFRLDQDLSRKTTSPLTHFINEEDGHKKLILYQEFNNYVLGRSIVNFYAEDESNEGIQRFIASSDKRITTLELINRILQNTSFKKIADKDVKLSDIVIRYCILGR